MSFKGNKIWVNILPTGDPLTRNNKVLIKYNLDQDHEYWIKKENLRPEKEAVPSSRKPGKSPPRGKGKPQDRINEERSQTLQPENGIRIYTDGASSGNPGPSGIGAVLIYKGNKKTLSRSIGHATNNEAELVAIEQALSQLKRFDLPVRLYTDSSYALGVLTEKLKARTNQDLIERIKRRMGKFGDLEIIKVKGHAGIKENETADFLATSAIKA